MSITDADRAGALRIAKARTERQHRGTGIYRVTVGGYVVGTVRRSSTSTGVWIACPEESDTPLTDPDRSFSGGNGSCYSTRKEAVARLARTDFSALSYRESAREGAQGTAEERRVREEDTARLEQLDAVAEESSGPALELVEGAYRTADGRFTVRRIEADTYRIEDERASRVRYDRSIADARETIGKILGVEEESRSAVARGFVAEEVLTIPTASARPGDLVIELDGDAVTDIKVLEPLAHVYGAGKGPLGVRVTSGSRSAAIYIYVDQYPRITVRRPASRWTRFPVGATVAHKDDDHAARSTAVVVEPTVDEWLDMDRDDLPAVLVEWRPAGRRVWEYAEDLQKI